jgi:hypothetical protein
MKLHRDHDVQHHGEVSAGGTNAADLSSEQPSIEELLAADHQRMERLFQAIAVEAALGDSELLHRQWTAFGQELTRHMDVEEVRIISAFSRDQPNEARGLLDDHARIRSMLTELAIDLDVHRLRPDRIRALVAELDEHARRETVLLYPWTDGLDPAARESFRWAHAGERGCECCEAGPFGHSQP